MLDNIDHNGQNEENGKDSDFIVYHNPYLSFNLHDSSTVYILCLYFYTITFLSLKHLK